MFKKYMYVFARITIAVLLGYSSTTIAAIFSASPSPSTTGNYVVSWSGANSGLPVISEVINGVQVVKATGNANGSFQVTGKPTGRYQYLLEQKTPGVGSGQGAPTQIIFVDVILATTSTPSSSTPSSSSSSSVSSAVTINVDRSLLVHDKATLDAADFSLLSVMNTLADQMTAANPADPITGTKLFARMWDAQNPTSQSAQTGIRNCTGVTNNFTIECRPEEGIQAFTADSFIKSYVPIALVNRFDLRDKATSKDCGEYRIIFGRTNINQRNFIIFEAEVPNPTPGTAKGCIPIQAMWKNLSAEANASTRAGILRNFYFNGIPASSIRAPIDSRNFSGTAGQIRTNQFIQVTSWNLKEYKLTVENGKNTAQVVTVKSNPVGNLFDVNNTDPRAAAFQSDFVNNLGSLLGNISTFSLTVSNDAHNNAQSHASGPTSENAFIQQFTNSRGSAFETQIRNKLTSLGSPLTVDQTLNRATAMTCGGCHQPSAFGLTTPGSIGANQSWPNSAGFVHVSEFASNGIFPISQALSTVFLPARKADMESFLINPGIVSEKLTSEKLTPNASSSSSASPLLGKRSG